MTSTTLVLRSWLSMVVPPLALLFLAAEHGIWAMAAGIIVGWVLGLVLVFAVWPKIWR